VGEYYAYYPDPPKGRVPIGAKKVRLRYTEQRKRSTMENRQTWAAITVVDTSQEKLVRARELIDFWDSYSHEEALLLKEKKDREKDIRRQQLRSEVTLSILNHRAQEMDVPLIFTSTYRDTLSVSAVSVFEWLGITEEEITTTIDEAIQAEFDET